MNRQLLIPVTTIPSDTDISQLEAEALQDQKLLVQEAKFYQQFEQMQLSAFCLKYGFYNLPTIELTQWLKEEIGDNSAIEIGCGHGALAKALDIPATDSCMQNLPEIKSYYATIGQATVSYPPEVDKLEALEALEVYEPDIVLGCWITHKYNPARHEIGGSQWGVDEAKILNKAHKYILVGHDKTHWGKPINLKTHKTIRPPWLFSRSAYTAHNFIKIWER